MLDIRNFNRGITLSGSRNEPHGHNMKYKIDADTVINGLVIIGFIAFSAWIIYSHLEFASRMEATRQAFSQR